MADGLHLLLTLATNKHAIRASPNHLLCFCFINVCKLRHDLIANQKKNYDNNDHVYLIAFAILNATNCATLYAYDLRQYLPRRFGIKL